MAASGNHLNQRSVESAKLNAEFHNFAAIVAHLGSVQWLLCNDGSKQVFYKYNNEMIKKWIAWAHSAKKQMSSSQPVSFLREVFQHYQQKKDATFLTVISSGCDLTIQNKVNECGKKINEYSKKIFLPWFSQAADPATTKGFPSELFVQFLLPRILAAEAARYLAYRNFQDQRTKKNAVTYRNPHQRNPSNYQLQTIPGYEVYLANPSMLENENDVEALMDNIVKQNIQHVVIGNGKKLFDIFNSKQFAAVNSKYKILSDGSTKKILNNENGRVHQFTVHHFAIGEDFVISKDTLQELYNVHELFLTDTPILFGVEDSILQVGLAFEMARSMNLLNEEEKAMVARWPENYKQHIFFLAGKLQAIAEEKAAQQRRDLPVSSGWFNKLGLYAVEAQRFAKTAAKILRDETTHYLSK